MQWSVAIQEPETVQNSNAMASCGLWRASSQTGCLDGLATTYQKENYYHFHCNDLPIGNLVHAVKKF